jgi:hypothetical protein
MPAILAAIPRMKPLISAPMSGRKMSRDTKMAMILGA